MRIPDPRPQTAALFSTSNLNALRLWLPVICAFTLLTAYSMKSGGQAPMPALTYRDKIEHFSVYGLLGILILQALPQRLQGTIRWLAAFTIASLFGMFDETLQHFNPARTGDPLDWFADSLGALLAVVAYTAIPAFRVIADWCPSSLLPIFRSVLSKGFFLSKSGECTDTAG